MSEPGDEARVIQARDIDIARVQNDVMWIKILLGGLYVLAVPDAFEFFIQISPHVREAGMLLLQLMKGG